MEILGHVDVVSHDELSGWVVDADRPGIPLDVLILVDGSVHAECSADLVRHGLSRHLPPGGTDEHEFRFRFEPRLTRRTGHIVEVLVRDGQTLVPNGRWRLPPVTVGRHGLMPVIVTSTGRAGTTMLMREFLTQPSIVVADAYPYEIKLASYYACAYKLLTEPQYDSTPDADGFAARVFEKRELVANPWNRPDLVHGIGGHHLARLLAKGIPGSLAGTFNRIIQDYYGTVAVTQGKVEPGYFAEKSVLHEETRQAVRELAGTIKELILVRDPRDFICSAQAFWKRSPETSFDALRADIPLLLAIRAQSPCDVMFVRYEDLVKRPKKTRDGIYRLFGDRTGRTGRCS